MTAESEKKQQMYFSRVIFHNFVILAAIATMFIHNTFQRADVNGASGGKCQMC